MEFGKGERKKDPVGAVMDGGPGGKGGALSLPVRLDARTKKRSSPVSGGSCRHISRNEKGKPGNCAVLVLGRACRGMSACREREGKCRERDRERFDLLRGDRWINRGRGTR